MLSLVRLGLACKPAVCRPTGQMQTDGRTTERYIDPAPRILCLLCVRRMAPGPGSDYQRLYDQQNCRSAHSSASLLSVAALDTDRARSCRCVLCCVVTVQRVHRRRHSTQHDFTERLDGVVRTITVISHAQLYCSSCITRSHGSVRVL